MIEAKTIRLGEQIETGNLGANPVAALDSLCNPGQKALFAFPGVREFAPLTDWPLHPYTAYYTAGDELIWVTDDTPALGIRDEQVQALEHHIYPGEALDSDAGTLTGLNPDWLTRSTNTCDGWTSSSENLLAARGNVYSTTDFLSGAPNRGCDDLTYIILLEGADTWITRVYCVEQ